jgi:ribosome-associated protein
MVPVMNPKNDPTIQTAQIDREPIELHKLLKFENLVQSGGEAKFVISEGLVRLNGDIETRKRKKVFDGDVVEFNGEKFRVAAIKK